MGFSIRILLIILLLETIGFTANAAASTNGNEYFSQWQNGLPSDQDYFPIAVWLQSPGRAQSYKNIGINLYIGLWQGPTESQLNQLEAADMMVICNQNQYALDNLQRYRDTIIGWMYIDEPDNAQKWDGSDEWGRCYLPYELVDIYDDLVAHDSTRPVYVNFGQGVVEGTGYLGRWYLDEAHLGPGNDYSGENYSRYYTEASEAADILSFDIYPIAGGYGSENLWYVGQGISNLKNWTLEEKPTWCWIETTRISSTVKPTTEQVRTEVWMAIINGATGIGYFCHEFSPSFNEDALLDDTGMRDAVAAINQEVQDYAPVLNSLLADGSVSITAETDIETGVTILAKYFQDRLYLFTINERGTALDATFSIDGLEHSNTEVEVLGENRSITYSDGQFSDSFSGYGIHIYRLNHTIQPEPGDVDNNGVIDLHDLVLTLQVLSDLPTSRGGTWRSGCKWRRKAGPGRGDIHFQSTRYA